MVFEQLAQGYYLILWSGSELNPRSRDHWVQHANQ